MLSEPIDGTEDKARRALIFYTASSKIVAEGANVPNRIRLEVLGHIIDMVHVSETNVQEVFRIYTRLEGMRCM